MHFSPKTKIFLASGVTDMRKSFNGLSAIAANEIEKETL